MVLVFLCLNLCWWLDQKSRWRISLILDKPNQALKNPAQDFFFSNFGQVWIFWIPLQLDLFFFLLPQTEEDSGTAPAPTGRHGLQTAAGTDDPGPRRQHRGVPQAAGQSVWEQQTARTAEAAHQGQGNRAGQAQAQAGVRPVRLGAGNARDSTYDLNDFMWLDLWNCTYSCFVCLFLCRPIAYSPTHSPLTHLILTH